MKKLSPEFSGRQSGPSCSFWPKAGQSFARLRFNVGPGGEIKIPVSVDYTLPFAGSNWESWQQEYDANLVDIDMLLQEEPAPQRKPLAERSNTIRELPRPEDPFFDPQRFELLDEYELLLQGYYYDY